MDEAGRTVDQHSRRLLRRVTAGTVVLFLVVIVLNLADSGPTNWFVVGLMSLAVVLSLASLWLSEQGRSRQRD